VKTSAPDAPPPYSSRSVTPGCNASSSGSVRAGVFAISSRGITFRLTGRSPAGSSKRVAVTTTSRRGTGDNCATTDDAGRALAAGSLAGVA
jgi:hypothetical protein